MMVLQEGSGFNELRNTTDSLEQNKCFKNSREVRIDQESVCEGKERETVETLQSAFLKFKRNRQKLHQVALADKKQIKRSDEQTDKLRQKFIEQLKHYIGVPYARRYHEPGSAEYDSPLFLDCCGLVRKVLRDMKEDFGFSIGPWNQAYMFDTLPNSINDTKDMKPGDLVFVSGTFYNPKKRKQKHNIVHVEIWAGDGEKTIGARWQKGKVQVHESYQYVSKSYYNMVYHFKSIDTWLNGICKSFCPQHSWTLTSSYIPGRKSIFSTHQADELADGASEEQFTEENQKYIEKRGTCFEGKCSEKKVQDDKQGDDEEKSDLVGKAAPEQENISYVQENKFYCETILSCYAENFTSDVVAVEENEPKGCKIKNRENAVDRNVVFVRKDRQEKNKLNDKKEDILDHECADFHVVDQVNMPNLRQREFNAKEPISCKKNEENFRSKPFQEDCERCTSNADISQFEEEDSEHCEAFPYRRLLIGSELVNDNDHLDTVNDYPGLSLETIDLCWSDVREGKTSEGVTFNNTIEQMTDFRSRPNSSEAAGAAGTRKHVMTTQAVNRRGKGTVSPAYYLSDKQDFDVSSEDPSYGIRKGLRSRRQNLVCRLGGSRRRQNGDDDQSNNRREPSKPFCKPNPSFSRLHQKPPTFFIGGHNGAKMVEATLSSLGWERIHDKNDTKFYLKWVECKRNLDFASFREGEQLVNHIPNGNLLTTKIGLLTSLQKFERVSNTVPSLNRRSIHMKDFVPETFRLQNQAEIQTFIQHIYQDGEMWICKPTGMNQGKGIFLIRSRDELLEKLGPRTNTLGRQGCFPAPGRVIQRYILNPFLLNGYKADIRTYMLIAGTTPYMVFYHPGYIRLSLVPFSLHQEEVHAHLTNQYIQKKHPLYEQVKEKTVWSMEQLQEYLNKSSNNTLPPDWVYTTFTKRMEEIMLHCFQSVRYKLDRKLGYFDLLGFDFMLDENMNVWLIEINVNPALHTNCKILSGVIPELVDTTLRLVLEVFEKSKRKEKVFPLENQGKFQLIFSDEKK